MSVLSSVLTFCADVVSSAWSSLWSDAPPPPDGPVTDTGGGGGGEDTGSGGGGGDDSGGGGDSGGWGDTGINWGDTGWEGWETWDSGYPYVETEDQTCFAEEKFEKPVCYAKGGKTQEREVLVQGLKCSSVDTQVPLVGVSWTLVVAVLVWRTRRHAPSTHA